MNREPFGIPPQWWAPRMAPWCVKLSRRYRHRQLRRHQRVIDIEVRGLHHLESAINQDHGVLITPNHSAHYDSATLYAAADQIGQPLYFMTAWQVFAMSNRFERWLMQRLGCFSIDREATDRQAFKQGVRILQEERHPLVVFPEGDIYHVSDRVTPFREGAAAIALSASRRHPRQVVAVPCAIKFWYVDDVTGELEVLMAQLEQRLYLRTSAGMPLTDRVYRLAGAALALKEIDFLGRTGQGTVKERIATLTEHILSQLEQKYHIDQRDAAPPERVKRLRQRIISAMEETTDDEQILQLGSDMEDIFFVVQLFSYPGNYLRDQPTLERVAETLDKLEEDILHVDYPSVRGRRRAVVSFGDPAPVETGAGERGDMTRLTEILQQRVQTLLDELNCESVGREVAS